MKRVSFLLLLIISTGSFAQWKTIRGNGNIQKEERKVGAFSGIELKGSMNVELRYGSSNSITVEADENLLPYIETSVSNGNLVIKQRNNSSLKHSGKFTIYASTTSLKDISLSGSGNIKGNGNFTTDDNMRISVSGSGNIDLAIISVDNLGISLAGSGDVKISGSNCDNLSASISGSGNIDCYNLKTEDVDVKVSGSGYLKANATNSIDARVSGSGNIYYKGGPSKINTKVSGSGKIIKA